MTKKYHITKSKRFKVIGGGVLLFAFITQWTFYNYAKAEKDNWFFAIDGYSRAYLASLTYVNLYFTEGQTTGAYDGAVLKKAAQENAYGFSMRIAISPLLTSQEKTEHISKIVSISKTVNDIDSYNAYINTLNQIEKPLIEKTEKEIDNLNKLVAMSLWLYLSIYCLGSIMLLIGTMYEKA